MPRRRPKAKKVETRPPPTLQRARGRAPKGSFRDGKKCPLNRTPTKAEVILGHQTAWEEYTLEEYWKHLEQMPLRMEACIRAKGFRFYKELRQLKREKILEKK
jgi:hypothetical protein